MAALDLSDCPLVEIIADKVSGAPLLKNTRLPVDAITETLDCYPEAGLDAIKAILDYRATHQSGSALRVLFNEDVPKRIDFPCTNV
jgi:uncharacterized protein (DUF433 family)